METCGNVNRRWTMPRKRVFSTSGSVFEFWLVSGCWDCWCSETQWPAGHWLPVQMERLVFGFLMKKPLLAGPCVLKHVGDRAQASIWSFTCVAEEGQHENWAVVCAADWVRCLQGGVSSTLTLLSCLYHLGRYWCHYHYPRINGRSPVFESRSRDKYFTADPEGETCKTDLCCVFSFHLPVRISSGVAAVLIWCKSNL